MSEWWSSRIERSAPMTDRGWFSPRLFNRFELLPRRFYQFRLAFCDTQAKGAFKVMDNDVADFLGADIVLPESSIKPSPAAPISEPGVHFQTDIVPGVREVSRLLAFESSYTLIVHAPRESVEQEIIPEARVSIGKAECGLLRAQSSCACRVVGEKSSRLTRTRRKRRENSPSARSKRCCWQTAAAN